MIVGVGTDIVKIHRIERAASNIKFLEKVFSAEELAEYREKGAKIQTLAGKFAAKEAVSKCLKTGFSNFWPRDIEILGYGEPNAFLRGKALEAAEDLGIRSFHVSISHTDEDALAFAVAEGYDRRT